MKKPPPIPRLYEEPVEGLAAPTVPPASFGDVEPSTERDVGSSFGKIRNALPVIASDDGTSTDRTAVVEDRSIRIGGRASFTVLSGLHAGQVHPVDRSLVIGRGKTADVIFHDVGLSRQHARLSVNQGTYVIEDLDSTNGVRVNGERVDKALLREGDRVQLGPDVVIQFAFLDDAEQNFTKRLYVAATRDLLTSALNRRVFDERLKAELSYARRHSTRLSVIILDIDHFKRVNDTHGHGAGDEVLRKVAGTIQTVIRDEDVFARYGGEEFVILVRGETTAQTAIAAERIRSAVTKLEMTFDGKPVPLTLSAGVAEYSECSPGTDGEGLLKLADERLYRAKQTGRDRVCSG
jgi:diguanylate cyclase (GGDEF)-like protein